MRQAEFRHFLQHDYKQDISPMYLSEIISRCNRVESSLSVNLDQVNDPETLFNDVNQITCSASEARSIRSALNRYTEFKNSKKPPKKDS